jgi:tetrahydromethanopterin S-methyltransferase subunit G
MALDKNDLQQIKSLLDEQSSVFNQKFELLDEKIDAQSVSINHRIEKLDKRIDERIGELHARISLEIKMSLSPLENSLYDIKEELKRLNQRETGDIGGAYNDIADVKKRLAKLERQVAKLEQ